MLAFGPSRFVYFWLSIAWIWLPAKTHLIASDNNLSSEARSSRGLVVLYTFQEMGNIVHDEAGFGTPLNLEIKQLKRVRRNAGSLAIRGEVEISSNSGTRKLSQAINRSGEITVEVWIEPDNVTQAGPARIVSLSSDSSHRNFTLGQDKDRFDFRLRTQKTNENGLPSLSSPKKLATTQLTHLVYTHRRDGRRHLYINGKRQSESSIAGSFSNWRNDFQLRLADEAGGGRLWRGTYHLVAIFDRCLTETEVEQHFRLGAEAKSPAREAPKQLDHFVTKIAPIFAEHCLECHDASTRRGGLDLSHKTSAFVGAIAAQRS